MDMFCLNWCIATILFFLQSLATRLPVVRWLFRRQSCTRDKPCNHDCSQELWGTLSFFCAYRSIFASSYRAELTHPGRAIIRTCNASVSWRRYRLGQPVGSALTIRAELVGQLGCSTNADVEPTCWTWTYPDTPYMIFVRWAKVIPTEMAKLCASPKGRDPMQWRWGFNCYPR